MPGHTGSGSLRLYTESNGQAGRRRAVGALRMAVGRESAKVWKFS